jgi:hypothetical protein
MLDDRKGGRGKAEGGNGWHWQAQSASAAVKAILDFKISQALALADFACQWHPTKCTRQKAEDSSEKSNKIQHLSNRRETSTFQHRTKRCNAGRPHQHH